MSSVIQEPFIPLARITRPQGLRGEVRVQIEFVDLRLFVPGREVILTLADRQQKATIEDFRSQHRRSVLKLEGIDSISEAEIWVGGRISIPSQDLLEAEPGSFYSFELEGCWVYSDGEWIGTVRAVVEYAGTEMLALDREGEEVLIPFIHAFLKTVDTDEKRIDVELPEGLVELNERK